MVSRDVVFDETHVGDPTDDAAGEDNSHTFDVLNDASLTFPKPVQ